MYIMFVYTDKAPAIIDQKSYMCIHIIPRKRGTHLDMCAAYCENNGMKSVSFQHKHGRIAWHVQIVNGMHWVG